MADQRPPARAARRAAVHDFKRGRILDAAAEIFAVAGLGGAKIRAIADRAGCAVGTIYRYYATKEEIHADLVRRSLGRLHQAVRQAVTATDEPWAGVQAFFDYYRARPEELGLGLYLYRGGAPPGLTPELDRQLNGRLIQVLSLIAHEFGRRAGRDPAAAEIITVDLVSHAVGLILLQAAGRLKMLGYDAETLFRRRLAEDKLLGQPI